MQATIVEIYVLIVAVVLAATIAVYFNIAAAIAVSAAVTAWLITAKALAATGIVQNVQSRPPGPVFLLGPVAAYLIALMFSRPLVSRIANALPLWLLIAFQSFRIGVELILHAAWHQGIVPKMLTYSGANYDLYLGLSALPIAWLASRGSTSRQWIAAWNWLGLAVLGNVVVRALLTAPGPLNMIHAEIPNQIISTFPYLLIPAFFVPLAATGHVLALHKLKSRQLFMAQKLYGENDGPR